MTAKELAEKLNGCTSCREISMEDRQRAAESGLVVVFGYSSDCVEFRGAINEMVEDMDGDTFWPAKHGVYQAPVRCDPAKNVVKAVWHDKGGPYWTFETDIPHETFNVYDGGELFCVGIVFSTDGL